VLGKLNDLSFFFLCLSPELSLCPFSFLSLPPPCLFHLSFLPSSFLTKPPLSLFPHSLYLWPIIFATIAFPYPPRLGPFCTTCFTSIYSLLDQANILSLPLCSLSTILFSSLCLFPMLPLYNHYPLSVITLSFLNLFSSLSESQSNKLIKGSPELAHHFRL
jgi:hypothetical protein